LPISSIIPLIMGRFGLQDTEKITGGIIGAGAHNENISKKKSVSFPLATKGTGNLKTRARHKEISLSGRKR
jgi:hypothetical protein